MPKQTTRSSFADKIGDAGRRAFDAHKDDETKSPGGGDLPAGIENGIARLVEFKFDVYKEGDSKGEFYCYAAGVVVEPDTVEENGRSIPIKGLRTSYMEPLCDTPTRTRKSMEDHLAHVMNTMRLLGVNTSEMGFDDLESTAEALKEAAPYFRFRTWKGEKQTTGPYAGQEPRVQHQWRGIVEDYSPPDENQVDDQTDAPPQAKSPVPKTAAPKPASAPASKAPAKTPPVKTAKTEEVPFGDKLDMLVEQCNAGDSDAAEELKTIGIEHGLEPEVFDDADTTWEQVADMIREKADGGTDEANATNDTDWTALGEQADNGDDDAIQAMVAEAEARGIDHASIPTYAELAEQLNASPDEAPAEEPWKPAKGDVYYFKPIDPKTKKPGKKVECEVTAVNEKGETVDLKSLDNPKIVYKTIKWTALEQ